MSTEPREEKDKCKDTKGRVIQSVGKKNAVTNKILVNKHMM
jgi:hypothetical protein